MKNLKKIYLSKVLTYFLTAIIILAGPLISSAQTSSGTTTVSGTNINLSSSGCSPTTTTVPTGTTVTWTNNGGNSNTLNGINTSGTGNNFPFSNQSVSANGGTYSYTFNNPGTYSYYCGNNNSSNISTITVSSPSTTSSTSGNSAANRTVSIQNFSFIPSTITINQGDTVTWTNLDKYEHSVISDSGNELASPILSTNQSYGHTFNQAGTFTYHCSLHPNMTGTVVVTGIQNQNNANNTTGYSYDNPSPVTNSTPQNAFIGNYGSNPPANNKTSTNSYQCTSFDQNGFCTNYVPSNNSPLPFLSNNSVGMNTTGNSNTNFAYSTGTTNTGTTSTSNGSNSFYTNPNSQNYSCDAYDMSGNCVTPVPSLNNSTSNTTNNSGMNSTSGTSTSNNLSNNQGGNTESNSNITGTNMTINSGMQNMMMVKAYALHVRSSAGIAKNIIGYLKNGDNVNVLSRSNDNRWCQIDPTGLSNIKNSASNMAWVACRYLGMTQLNQGSTNNNQSQQSNNSNNTSGANTQNQSSSGLSNTSNNSTTGTQNGQTTSTQSGTTSTNNSTGTNTGTGNNGSTTNTSNTSGNYSTI